MDGAILTRRIIDTCLDLGFSHAGVIPCEDVPAYAEEASAREGYDRFTSNPQSFVGGCYPSRYFPQGKSIVCATFGFAHIDYPEELTRFIGRAYLSRSYVPLPESIAGLRVSAVTRFLEDSGMEVYQGPIEYPARYACARAGIVTYGNNNFAYTEEDGSLVILYTWLVDRELDWKTREIRNGCPPHYHLCQEACPTQALVKPAQLDPMRCILLNDLMPEPAVDTTLMGTHIHGCDVCQMVCPRNKEVLSGEKRKDPFLELLAERFDLVKVLSLESFEDDYYIDVVRPIMYNYIRDVELFRKNAAIAMGNSGDAGYIPALEHAASRHPDSLTAKYAEEAIAKLRETTL